MSSLISALGISIMFGKYALFVLFAGLTLASGANAADPVFMMALDND